MDWTRVAQSILNFAKNHQKHSWRFLWTQVQSAEEKQRKNTRYCAKQPTSDEISKKIRIWVRWRESISWHFWYPCLLLRLIMSGSSRRESPYTKPTTKPTHKQPIQKIINQTNVPTTRSKITSQRWRPKSWQISNPSKIIPQKRSRRMQLCLNAW